MDNFPNNPQALPAGIQIEEFIIERVVRSDGFGITYLAKDTTLDRQVIIKENLPAHLTYRDATSLAIHSGPDREHQEYFQNTMDEYFREAEILSALDHPGIIRVLRQFVANSTAYLVMPFVEGETLEIVIKDRWINSRSFTEEELSNLLDRILDSLGYLHDKGICHQGIKPANILITAEGIPILINFEAALPIRQVKGLDNAEPRDDIYALGAALVKAMTFEILPKAADRKTRDKWTGLIRDQWLGLSANPKISKEYSPHFLNSIEKALAPLPDLRWYDARQWQLALCSSQPSSEVVAVNILRKEAETGDTNAMNDLGVCYHNGKGVTKDNAGAIKWFLKAAEAGCTEGMLNLGIYYEDDSRMFINRTEAIDWYRKAADAGDAKAMNNLGICYEFSMGVNIDEAEAVKWYRKAADAGDTKAMNNLGICYENGKGVTTDIVQAVNWYRKAVDEGCANGMFNLADCYMNYAGEVKWDRWDRWYRWNCKAAEAGDTNAMKALERCYEEGEGVTKDRDEAAEWYRKAADTECISSMFNLPVYDEDDFRMLINKTEAIDWYRKAADAGDAIGMLNLAICYENGKGLSKDRVEAANWYRKAAEAGDPSAMRILGNYYKYGEALTWDLGEAVKWYHKAAEAGDADAMSSLHNYYKKFKGERKNKNGNEADKWHSLWTIAFKSRFNLPETYNLYGVEGEDDLDDELESYCDYDDGMDYSEWSGTIAESLEYEARKTYPIWAMIHADEEARRLFKDKAEAAIWYRAAAVGGETMAMIKLGICYEYGIGVITDKVEAIKWYCNAADAGDTNSMNILGICYESGIGVNIDEAEAVKWYCKAADAGDANAMNKLGICYEFGTWVSRDEAKAITWYRKAADTGDINAMNNLGICYKYGVGTLIDEDEALKWFRKSAEAGNTKAMNNLGKCYQHGRGSLIDEAEAVKWYRKAADAGDTNAMHNLGTCHENGKGVATDMRTVNTWYTKAEDACSSNTPPSCHAWWQHADVARQLRRDTGNLRYKYRID